MKPITYTELINMSLTRIFLAIRIFFLRRALKWEQRFLESAVEEANLALAAQQIHSTTILNLKAQLRDLES